MIGDEGTSGVGGVTHASWLQVEQRRRSDPAQPTGECGTPSSSEARLKLTCHVSVSPSGVLLASQSRDAEAKGPESESAVGLLGGSQVTMAA